MSTATQTLHNFLTAISAMEIDKVQAMFADDVTQFIPFAPKGTPDTMTGKEAVASAFAGLLLMFKELTFANIELVETTDDYFAIGFAEATATLMSGAPYSQRYVFYVRVNHDGLIKDYREYMNPIVLGEALSQITPEN